MAIGKDTRTLEQSIGYTFADPSLAAKAMTHTSYANEMRDLGHRFESNQRLEFLGDAVVEILVSEELYVRFPDADEGLLTNMRKYLVCRETMAKIAEKLAQINYTDSLVEKIFYANARNFIFHWIQPDLSAII